MTGRARPFRGRGQAGWGNGQNLTMLMMIDASASTPIATNTICWMRIRLRSRWLIVRVRFAAMLLPPSADDTTVGEGRPGRSGGTRLYWM